MASKFDELMGAASAATGGQGAGLSGYNAPASTGNNPVFQSLMGDASRATGGKGAGLNGKTFGYSVNADNFNSLLNKFSTGTSSLFSKFNTRIENNKDQKFVDDARDFADKFGYDVQDLADLGAGLKDFAIANKSSFGMSSTEFNDLLNYFDEAQNQFTSMSSEVNADADYWDNFAKNSGMVGKGSDGKYYYLPDEKNQDPYVQSYKDAVKADRREAWGSFGTALQDVDGYNLGDMLGSYFSKVDSAWDNYRASKADLTAARKNVADAQATEAANTNYQNYSVWLGTQRENNISPEAAYNIAQYHLDQAQAKYDQAFADYKNAEATQEYGIDYTGYENSADPLDWLKTDGASVDSSALTEAARELQLAQTELEYAKNYSLDPKYIIPATDIDVVRKGAMIARELVRSNDESYAEQEGQYNEAMLQGLATDELSTGSYEDYKLKGYNGTTERNVEENRISNYLLPDNRWTEDELNAWYNYLGSGNRDGADKYAKTVNNNHNYQDAWEQEKRVSEFVSKDRGNDLGDSFKEVGAGALGTAYSIAAPLIFGTGEFVGNAIEAIGTGEISQKRYLSPVEMSSAITGSISQALNYRSGTISDKVPVVGGAGLGDVYQLGTSIAQSLLAMATGGEAGSMIMFFGSAASDGIYNAIDQGIDPKLAVAYGLMQGLAECAGERFSVENFLNNTIKKAAVDGFIKSVLLQAGIEASEEAFTTLLNTVSDAFINGNRSELQLAIYSNLVKGMSYDEAGKAALKEWLNGIGRDALGGFISGGFSAGAHVVTDAAVNSGREFAGNAKDLLRMTNYVDEKYDSIGIKEYAAKLEKALAKNGSLTQYQANKLDAKIQYAAQEQDVAKISSWATDTLAEMGEVNPESKGRLIGDITAEVWNESLEGKKSFDEILQEKIDGLRNQGMTNMAVVMNAMSQSGIMNSTGSLAGASNIGTLNIRPNARASVRQQDSDGNTKLVNGVFNRFGEPEARNVVNTRQAFDSDGEQGHISNLSVKDGKVQATVNTGKGSKTNYKQVDLETAPEEIRDFYSELKDALGSDEAAVEAFNLYGNNTDIGQYINAYSAARDLYGANAVERSRIERGRGSLTAVLNDEQFEAAYNSGLKKAANKGERKAKSSKDFKGKGRFITKPTNAQLTLNGPDGKPITLKAASREQLDAVGNNELDYISAVTKILNYDVIVYDSEFGSMQGAFFDSGIIYLDVNAGKLSENIGERALTLTLSHEITHFIQKYAPEQYEKLKQFVVSKLVQESGRTFDDLVQDKMGRGSVKTYEDAVDEIVADGCELMLNHSEYIRELAQQNRSLWQKIKDWIDDFIAKLRSMQAHSEEAKILLPYMEEQSRIWDAALREAVQNAGNGSAEVEVQESEREIKAEAPAKTESKKEKPAAVKSKLTYDDIYEADIKTTQGNELVKALMDAIERSEFTLGTVSNNGYTFNIAMNGNKASGYIQDADGNVIFNTKQRNDQTHLSRQIVNFESQKAVALELTLWAEENLRLGSSVMFSEKETFLRAVINKVIVNKGSTDSHKKAVIISPPNEYLTGIVSAASNGAIDISEKNISFYEDDIWHSFKRHSDLNHEISRDQIPLTEDDIVAAVLGIYSPNLVESLFTNTNNPTQRQAFAYAKRTPNGSFIVVETVGGRVNNSVFPVEIIHVTANKWNRWMSRGKTLGELLYEHDAKKMAALDVTTNKKNRVTSAQYAKLKLIRPAFSAFSSINNTIPQNSTESNGQFSERELLSSEDKAAQDLGKTAEVERNKNGDLLLAKNESGNTVVFSERTWLKGGRSKLIKALTENGHTQAEIEATVNQINDALDYLKILAAGYSKNMGYDALSNNLQAEIVTNIKTGKQALSALVNNGDYPVNIDLALICKKRVAYMNLMSRLIEDGVFAKVNYQGAAIAEVNKILRDNGFETACLGCFVESRRLQLQTWAETIVKEWNEEVDKRSKNAGSFGFAAGMKDLTSEEMDEIEREFKDAGKKNPQGNLNLGSGSVQSKMGRLLDRMPSLRKHLTVADLLTPDGLKALRVHDGTLFSLVKSRYGAASPKIVQSFNPYNGEIAELTFNFVKKTTNNAVKGSQDYIKAVKKDLGGTPKKGKGESESAFEKRKQEFNKQVENEAIRRYLYDIGGARIQSFSDFMIENVFDYLQIFADLSAKRLPLHGYTKEQIAIRLFGMTGAKWNGSLIAHVDPEMGKEYAGLLPASEAKNGNGILVDVDGKQYAIAFDDYNRNKRTGSFIQSIGMKDIIALQLDPRYSRNVGSITIGVSDKQILAMLDNPLFRMVIPYHASGMLPEFAKLVGVSSYNDYTDYQNTKIKRFYALDRTTVIEHPIGKDGKPVKVDTGFNFNAEVQKTGDARAAANNYLAWCDEMHPVYDGKTLVGYVTYSAKFSDSPYGTDFTKHENYYKLLEDFNVYDNLTENSAIQGAVTMTFPEEGGLTKIGGMDAYRQALKDTGIYSDAEIEKYCAKADMSFQQLIDDEIRTRAEYNKAQQPKWEGTVKQVEDMLLKDHSRESGQLSERDIQGMAKTAEAHFGITKDYREAGYITVNGNYLDFSGKHWGGNTKGRREVDHSDVSEILPDDFDTFAVTYKGEINRSSAMAVYEFQKYGNIRTQPETGSIELAIMPTKAQIEKIKAYFNSIKGSGKFDSFKVSFNDLTFGGKLYPAGYAKYDWSYSAEAVALDIEDYYRNGRMPENGSAFDKSIQDSWMFSERDNSRSDRELLADALIRMEGISDQEKAQLERYKAMAEDLDRIAEDLDGEIDRLRQLTKVDPFAKATVKQREKVNALRDKLTNADKQLLSLQSTKILNDVVMRERAKARAEAKQKATERFNERTGVNRYRKSINKSISTLENWILHNTDKEHVPEMLKAPLIEWLQTINMDSKRKVNGGEATKNDLRYAEKLGQLMKILQNQQDYMNDPEHFDGDPDVFIDLPMGFTKEIEQHIESVKSVLSGMTDIEMIPVNLMNASQLSDLDFILKVLTKSIKNINAFITESRFKGVEDAARSSIGFINELGSAGSFSIGKNGKTVDNLLIWSNTLPYYAFKRFGDAGMDRFDAITEGWGRMAFNVRQALNYAEHAYTSKEAKEWEDELHVIEIDRPGAEGSTDPADKVTISMTTAQIMSLYCLSQREQAYNHLMGGGMRIGNIEEGKGHKAIQQIKSVTLTPATLKQITDTLTARQMQVAMDLKRFMNTTCSAWGNEVSMARFGYRAFTETDYFPITTDDNLRPQVDPEQKKNDFFRLLNLSATKALTPRANNAIVISSIFDVFADHTADMAKYNALALPVLDIMKWYNFNDKQVDFVDEGASQRKKITTDSVHAAVEQAYGDQAKRYIMNLIRDLNGVKEGGRNEQFLKGLMGKYKAVSVAANVRVALQQPTSIARALLTLHPKYITRGIGMKNGIQEAMQWSGLAVWKDLGYFDTNVARNMRDQIKHAESTLDVIRDRSMILAEMGDKITWGAIWNACKLEVREKDPALKGDDLMQAVAKRFDEVILSTQVIDSTISRSELMRSTSLGVAEFTAFKSEPTVTYNALLNIRTEIDMDIRRMVNRGMDKKVAKAEAWKKHKGLAIRSVSVCAFTACLTSAAAAIADAGRDDDDYETLLQKWYSHFLDNLADNLNPVNTIPVVDSLVSAVTKGDIGTNMSLAALKQIYDAFAIIKEYYLLATGQLEDNTKVTYYGNMTAYGAVYKILQAGSYISGIPFASAMREAVSLYNFTIGSFTGKRIKTYDPGQKKAIQNAYDDKFINDEEAIQYLLEADPELDPDDAYWMVEGWKDGTGKYDQLFDAILSGDTKAIGAEMLQLTSHGVKERSMQQSIANKIYDWYAGEEQKITKQEAIDYLVKYAGKDKETATAKVQQLTCKVVTGIDYNDIQDLYMDYVNGDKDGLTATKAQNMLQLYGGLDAQEALDKVNSWTLQAKTGIVLGSTGGNSVKDAVVSGKITYQQAVDYLIKYGGNSPQKAEEYAKQYMFTKATGYNWSDRTSAYINGDVSKEQMKAYLIDINGVTEKSANSSIKTMEKKKTYSEQFMRETGYSWKDREKAYSAGKVSRDQLVSYFRNINGQSKANAEESVAEMEWEMSRPKAAAAAPTATGYTPTAARSSQYTDSKGRYTGTPAQTEDIVYSRLSQGLGGDKKIVAAIMGNMKHESGFTTYRYENDMDSGSNYATSRKFIDNVMDRMAKGEDMENYFTNNAAIPGWGGYGLIQVTNLNLRNWLYNYAVDTNRNLDDPEMQADYVVYLLKGYYNNTYKKMQEAKTVEEAAEIFRAEVEQSETTSAGKRQKYAADYYNRYT